MNGGRSTSWRFWLSIGLVFGLFIYLVQSILLPFVVGIFAAYFLSIALWNASLDAADDGDRQL